MVVGQGLAHRREDLGQVLGICKCRKDRGNAGQSLGDRMYHNLTG